MNKVGALECDINKHTTLTTDSCLFIPPSNCLNDFVVFINKVYTAADVSSVANWTFKELFWYFLVPKAELYRYRSSLYKVSTSSNRMDVSDGTLAP